MSDNLTVIKNFILVTQTKKAVRVRLENKYCIWLPKSMIYNYTKNSILVDRNIYSSNLNRAVMDKREKEYSLLRKINNDKVQGLQ